ncbi:MAG: hypothetical protein EPO13_05565 [Actinomycetota bacterium]|nr:MAG: hypothetical protein EPO13_05565 [Actinomycetota bacterium]
MSTSVRPSPATVDAPLQLDLTSPPRGTLSWLDQAALWASLGITLTLPAAAVFVLAPVAGLPGLSVAAAITAVVVGCVAGAALLGAAAVPGARTGAPAMALLRGLLGRRASYAPTVLNIVQCVGWAAVEVLVMTEVATRLTSDALRPVWAVVAGVLATAMALWPLGAIKAVRRYLLAAVAVATVVLFVGVLRSGELSAPEGDWTAFPVAFDIVVALPISWIPLAADYSRHSRTGRGAFTGAFVGYGLASIVYFLLGILAVLSLSGAAEAFTPTDFVPALLALPAGAIALLILLADEVDEAFANIYSTAMSVQNLAPRLDRRILAVIVGVIATAAALLVDLIAYESFLFLIGAVFIPLAVVLVVDWFVVRRLVFAAAGAGYSAAAPEPGRAWYLLPWLVGFAAYNLVSAGTVSWWADRWAAVRDALGFVPPSWLSASVLSAVVAAVLTVAIGVPVLSRVKRAARRG